MHPGSGCGAADDIYQMLRLRQAAWKRVLSPRSDTSRQLGRRWAVSTAVAGAIAAQQLCPPHIRDFGALSGLIALASSAVGTGEAIPGRSAPVQPPIPSSATSRWMAGALRRAMETLPIAVGLVGPGAVGRALLEQLRVEVRPGGCAAGPRCVPAGWVGPAVSLSPPAAAAAGVLAGNTQPWVGRALWCAAGCTTAECSVARDGHFAVAQEGPRPPLAAAPAAGPAAAGLPRDLHSRCTGCTRFWVLTHCPVYLPPLCCADPQPAGEVWH